MIWFYFLTGLLIGIFAVSVASLIVAFRQYIECERRLSEMFDRGFENGREWKDIEKELVDGKLEDIRQDLEEVRGTADGEKATDGL